MNTTDKPVSSKILNPNGTITEAPTSDGNAVSSSSAEDSTPFVVNTNGGYMQLTPLGFFNHTHGIQQVDHSAVETLVRNFTSFFARLGRRFAGVPIYIGHPDVPGLENVFNDRKAYGWIMELQIRNDGLYGRSKLSTLGKELINNGHFKFLSPFWEAKHIGTKDGRQLFSPTVLRSVGLTNEPNLPVLPLANTMSSTEGSTQLIGALVRINGAPLLDDESVNDGALPNDECNSNAACNPDTTQQTVLSNSNEQIGYSRVKELELKLDVCFEQTAALNTRLINSILDEAVARAKILPAERSDWQSKLENDFDSTSANLANAAPKLNLVPRSAELSRQTFPESEEQTRLEFISLVNRHVVLSNVSYHTAWTHIRMTNSELFSRAFSGNHHAISKKSIY